MYEFELGHLVIWLVAGVNVPGIGYRPRSPSLQFQPSRHIFLNRLQLDYLTLTILVHKSKQRIKNNHKVHKHRQKEQKNQLLPQSYTQLQPHSSQILNLTQSDSHYKSHTKYNSIPHFYKPLKNSFIQWRTSSKIFQRLS